MKTLDEELDEALGIIKKKDLHPPQPPPKELMENPAPMDPIYKEEWVKDMPYIKIESIAGEKRVAEESSYRGSSSTVETFQPSSKPAIDFKAIAQSSEFQRFIYYLFTGRTHRGSLERLKKDISEFKAKVARLRK